MSTKHREGEAKAWAELAEEKAEDGSPKYMNAAGNAEYWREFMGYSYFFGGYQAAGDNVLAVAM